MATKPRKVSDVITEDKVRNAMSKLVLRGNVEALAQRRFTDPADQTAFVAEETAALALTPDEQLDANDIALLLALNPKR